MSKTIEIASRHKGKIATKVKGESVTVEFKDTDTPDVFLALCDNDEAGAFLSIGLPDYWKRNVDADGGKESDVKIATAAEMIEKIRAAATVEDIEALIAEEASISETPRKSVMDEAAKRSKALTK